MVSLHTSATNLNSELRSLVLQEEQETEEKAKTRIQTELSLKREYRAAAMKANVLTMKREQGYLEAQLHSDALYDRVVTAAQRHPPKAYFELPYRRRSVDLLLRVFL